MALVIHPNITGEVEARAYQFLATQDALSGNTLVVMPTGFGKTAVQWLVMAEYLQKDGMIIILAPSIGLVDQHYEMAKEILKISEDEISILTGNTSPKDRPAIWDQSRMIVATPHVVRNDAQTGGIELKDVSLIVFDEAHHAKGNEPMAEIGNLYFQANPQGAMLGATASPGTKRDDILQVANHLQIERMHLAKRDDDLLKPYATEMHIENHRIQLPEGINALISPLKNQLSDESDYLRRGGFLSAQGRLTSWAINEAQRRASAAIQRDDNRGYDAARRIGDIRRLIRLIDLVETQGVKCALAYLERSDSERRKKNRKSARFLSLPAVHDAYRRLSLMDEIHPKLKLTKKTVTQGMRRHPEGRIIIFTEYRDTVDILCEFLKEDTRLRVTPFIGQASKGDSAGMNQKKQREVLQKFRDGTFNVLVATSVAEEGLDIPAAERVIMYEPVPSAIRAIQRRGRTARKSDGDVHAFITENTRDEYIQLASHNKEKKMFANLENLRRQARLPRKMPSSVGMLDAFSVKTSDGQIIRAEAFIESEKERLIQPKNAEAEADEPEIIQQEEVQLPQRPSSQRGLEEFIDRDSIETHLESAQEEVESIDPKKKQT